MESKNAALWLPKRSRQFQVAPAPYTPPAAGQLVIRVRAVAVNFIDGIPRPMYRLALPWLTFPAIVGSDVAGEVVEVGPGVTRFRIGDRVIGHAVGVDRSRNSAAEGAFQHFVVLLQRLVAPIPDSLSFESAAVLPLTLSTAATGLFQQDHLGLALPTAHPAPREETVLVWGGSTAVGSNAIQLARNSGYRVVATASPHNFDYVRSLGAAAVADYRSPDAVDTLVAEIGDSALAGTLAIGSGSIRPTLRIASRTAGSGRIASTLPALITRIRAAGSTRRGLTVSAIWGGTLKDNEVGPAVYAEFLPGALASGAYRAAPPATVVGTGLEAIPEALHRLRDGVSATKLVVTL